MAQPNKLNQLRELFGRLVSGDTAGLGDALLLAEDIQKGVFDAELKLTCLDPTGQKSADDIRQGMTSAISVAQVKDAREIFRRMAAGDPAFCNSAQLIADNIRTALRDVGQDVAALDPTGAKSAEDIEKELKAAVTAVNNRAAFRK
jgi:hypothetical protein